MAQHRTERHTALALIREHDQREQERQTGGIVFPHRRYETGPAVPVKTRKGFLARLLWRK